MVHSFIFILVCWDCRLGPPVFWGQKPRRLQWSTSPVRTAVGPVGLLGLQLWWEAVRRCHSTPWSWSWRNGWSLQWTSRSGSSMTWVARTIDDDLMTIGPHWGSELCHSASFCMIHLVPGTWCNQRSSPEGWGKIGAFFLMSKICALQHGFPTFSVKYHAW